MLYVSVFLYLLAIVFSYRAYRSGSKEAWGLAFAFFITAGATSLMFYVAIQAINGV